MQSTFSILPFAPTRIVGSRVACGKPKGPIGGSPSKNFSLEPTVDSFIERDKNGDKKEPRPCKIKRRKTKTKDDLDAKPAQSPASSPSQLAAVDETSQTSKHSQTLQNKACESYYVPDIARGFENIPISCINEIDNAEFPGRAFLYAPHRLISHRASSHMDYNTCRNCDCDTHSCGLESPKLCMCGRGSSTRTIYGYDEHSRLRVYSYPKTFKDPNIIDHWTNTLFEDSVLFECSFKCRCTASCNNRVVQAGMKHMLQVYRTLQGCWSVRTLEPIKQGEFVVEYCGELLTVREAEERIEAGDTKLEDTFFLWRKLKAGKFSSRFVLDSTKYSNVSKFIRHTAEPNLVQVKVVHDDAEVDLFHVALFAACDIPAGTELTITAEYHDRKTLNQAVPFDPTPHGINHISKSRLNETIRKHSHSESSHNCDNQVLSGSENPDCYQSSRSDQTLTSDETMFYYDPDTGQGAFKGAFITRKEFYQKLSDFLKSKGKTLRVTRIGGREIDMYIFYHEVVLRGGIQEIINTRRWREISKSLSVPVTATSAASELRRTYVNHLYEFEQLVVFGVENPPEMTYHNHPSKKREKRRLVRMQEANPSGTDDDSFEHRFEDNFEFLPVQDEVFDS